MSWLVALNAAGRFLAAILSVGVVVDQIWRLDVGVRDGGRINRWSRNWVGGWPFGAPTLECAKPCWDRLELRAWRALPAGEVEACDWYASVGWGSESSTYYCAGQQ